MFWRLFLVSVILALAAGAAYYFSDDVFDYVKKLWAFDEADRNRLKDWLEIAAGGLGILAVVLAFFAAVWKFIKSESKDDTSAKTVFEKEIRVQDGDFVVGSKIQRGGDDAG